MGGQETDSLGSLVYPPDMGKKNEEKKTNSTIALPVLKILRRESDKEHPLFQNQIIHWLRKELPAGSRLPNRKTVKDALDYLDAQAHLVEKEFPCRKAEPVKEFPIQKAIRGQGVFLGKRRFDEGLAFRLSMLIVESDEFSKSEKNALVKTIYEDHSRYTMENVMPAIEEAISRNSAAGMARSSILNSITKEIKSGTPLLVRLKGKSGAITVLPLRWAFAPRLSVVALVHDKEKGGVKSRTFAIDDLADAKRANPGDDDYKVLNQAFDEGIRKSRWEIDAPIGEPKDGARPVPYVDEEGGLFLSYRQESLDERDRDEALALLARHATFEKGASPEKVLFAIEWAYAGEDANDCKARRKILRADQPFLGAILVYCSWLVRQDGTSPEAARKALGLVWQEAAGVEEIGTDGWSRLVASLAWHLLLHRDGEFNDLAFPEGSRYIDRGILLNFVTDIGEWEKLADRAEKIGSVRWLRPLLYIYLESFVGEEGFDETRLWRLFQAASPLPEYIDQALVDAIYRLKPEWRADAAKEDYLYDPGTTTDNPIGTLGNLLDERAARASRE